MKYIILKDRKVYTRGIVDEKHSFQAEGFQIYFKNDNYYLFTNDGFML